MTTGLGDLLVWASKEGKFGYKNLMVSKADTLRLTLENDRIAPHSEIYDLVPPKALKAIAGASEADKKRNEQRLAHEDSIRNRTMSLFKDSAWIFAFAKAHGMSSDSLMRIFRLSYGNWRETIDYLEGSQANTRKMLLPLTDVVSAKDLSDSKASLLSDHLRQSMATAKAEDVASELFVKYVLSPRVDNEMLSPWRSFLTSNLGSELAAACKKDINALTGWMKSHIRIDPVANKHSRAPLTPIGVFNLRTADPLSRDIFFVAACRSFGIPARLNPETRVPEYFKDKIWQHAVFGAAAPIPETGRLILKDVNNKLTPQYSLHFTLARIQSGVCQTLEFDEGRKLTDFPVPLVLETGDYMLVTGRRLSDGSVLRSLTFFGISKEKSTTL